MRKNTYRLGEKPISYYEGLYGDSNLRVIDLGSRGKRATTLMADGGLEIEVEFPVEFGELRADLLPLGRSVISQIVAMDDAARRERADDVHDDDEELSAIIVREFFVEFEYTAMAWNSNWWEYFTPEKDGTWRHRGLRLPWMRARGKQFSSEIAALDVAYDDDAATAAGVVFADWDAEQASTTFRKRVAGAPSAYQPGEFYKRELPLLMALLNESPQPIAEIVIDGYVWLSADGKPGLGARLFEALGRRVPVIGVAKTKFHEDDWSQPVRRGASEAPLYVTAVGMDRTDAAGRISRMSGDARIPALLKHADSLARETLR